MRFKLALKKACGVRERAIIMEDAQLHLQPLVYLAALRAQVVSGLARHCSPSSFKEYDQHLLAIWLDRMVDWNWVSMSLCCSAALVLRPLAELAGKLSSSLADTFRLGGAHASIKTISLAGFAYVPRSALPGIAPCRNFRANCNSHVKLLTSLQGCQGMCIT